MPTRSWLPPRQERSVRLELRCQGWIPRQLNPASQDDRMLGVAAFAVEMTAEGCAATRVFSVNSETWKESPAPALSKHGREAAGLPFCLDYLIRIITLDRLGKDQAGDR